MLAIERGSKLLMNSNSKTADMGEGGVKNPEKLATTSFLDSPLQNIKAKRSLSPRLHYYQMYAFKLISLLSVYAHGSMELNTALSYLVL